MNLIEFKRLTECRERLDNIRPRTPAELEELTRVKDILDSYLEFRIFPESPDPRYI